MAEQRLQPQNCKVWALGNQRNKKNIPSRGSCDFCLWHPYIHSRGQQDQPNVMKQPSILPPNLAKLRNKFRRLMRKITRAILETFRIKGPAWASFISTKNAVWVWPTSGRGDTLVVAVDILRNRWLPGSRNIIPIIISLLFSIQTIQQYPVVLKILEGEVPQSANQKKHKSISNFFLK